MYLEHYKKKLVNEMPDFLYKYLSVPSLERLKKSWVSLEIHDLFIDTLNLIKKYYDNKEEDKIVESQEVHDSIVLFFHSTLVSEQVFAANKIQELLKESYKIKI